MIVEPGSSHPGYTRHTNAGAADRCEDVGLVDHVRCQLMPHADGMHAAATAWDVKTGVVLEYDLWGEAWTKPIPGQAPLPWAVGFPRVEQPDTPR